MLHLLQFATILLQNAIVITKCHPTEQKSWSQAYSSCSLDNTTTMITED